MTQLKIDGLRDVSNAVAAADAGADFLGFVFVPGARRQLTRETARDIIREYRRLRGPGGPRLVGLFADQPQDEVDSTARHCGLDMAQLCGDEPSEYWQGLSLPVIKMVKVHENGPVDTVVARVSTLVDRVASLGHTVVLDKHHAGEKGGTGRSFDWRIAGAIAACHDFFLAGGLTPENVARAIDVAHPWGVDVSSGVETDGVKDTQKIMAFAAAVRRADA